MFATFHYRLGKVTEDTHTLLFNWKIIYHIVVDATIANQLKKRYNRA